MAGQAGLSGGQNRKEPKEVYLDGIDPPKPVHLMPEAYNEFDQLCDHFRSMDALSSTDGFIIADIATWMYLYQLCIEDIQINGMILNSGSDTVKKNPSLEFFKDSSNAIFSRMYKLEDRSPKEQTKSGDKLKDYLGKRSKGPAPQPAPQGSSA